MKSNYRQSKGYLECLHCKVTDNRPHVVKFVPSRTYIVIGYVANHPVELVSSPWLLLVLACLSLVFSNFLAGKMEIHR